MDVFRVILQRYACHNAAGSPRCFAHKKIDAQGNFVDEDGRKFLRQLLDNLLNATVAICTPNICRPNFCKIRLRGWPMEQRWCG